MKTLFAALLVSGLMMAQGALAANEAASPAQPVVQTATQPATAQGATHVGKAEKKKADKKAGQTAKTHVPAVENK